MSYIPIDVEELAINRTITIGVSDSNGGDNFNLFVCSPEWITKNLWEAEIFRHTLIVREYDLHEIKKTITSYIEKCIGNT